MVADLNHYLDLPPEVPAPARRLAEQLGNIVRAATAGDTDAAWETALPCRRRPANRPCPGRMVVQRTETEAPIRWHCRACGDTGVITNWCHSPYDLRRRGLAVAEPTYDILITVETAAALRELLLLDPDSERRVFAMRADPKGAILSVTIDELDELIGAVAAEANHGPNRRRQQRLDAAINTLEDTADNLR